MSSFFEKLTGSHHGDEEENEEENNGFMEEVEKENEEGQLSVDVYQTPTEIVVRAITPGLKPDDLDVDLTREMITIRGERKNEKAVEEGNYFYQELYWGSFSRSILLPQEIDPDSASAEIKNGVLTITLPKLDKERKSKIKIKHA